MCRASSLGMCNRSTPTKTPVKAAEAARGLPLPPLRLVVNAPATHAARLLMLCPCRLPLFLPGCPRPLPLHCRRPALPQVSCYSTGGHSRLGPLSRATSKLFHPCQAAAAKVLNASRTAVDRHRWRVAFPWGNRLARARHVLVPPLQHIAARCGAFLLLALLARRCHL